MSDEVAGPAATEGGSADEEGEIQRLASPVPGEKSWEAIARKRQLIAQLEAAVKRDMPHAIQEARSAEVAMTDLAELWNVSAAWIYTIAPARSRRRGTGK